MTKKLTISHQFWWVIENFLRTEDIAEKEERIVASVVCEILKRSALANQQREPAKSEANRAVERAVFERASFAWIVFA